MVDKNSIVANMRLWKQKLVITNHFQLVYCSILSIKRFGVTIIPICYKIVLVGEGACGFFIGGLGKECEGKGKDPQPIWLVGLHCIIEYGILIKYF